MMPEFLSKFLKSEPKQGPSKEVVTPLAEVAWSESRLYGAADYPKYNPDGLVGRKGHKIYNKMMLDEQIKAVVKFRRDAITGRDWMFQYAEESDLSESEQEDRVRVMTEALVKMDGTLVDGLNSIMRGMYQGYSFTEINYRQIDVNGKTWYGLGSLTPKPHDTFQVYTDEYGTIQKVEQQLGGDEQEIPLERFVYYVHNPDVDRHYGQSDLREAYRPWFSKDVAIKYYNIFLERMASGFVVATVDRETGIRRGTTEWNQLENMIYNIQGTISMIVPEGVNIEVITPKSTDQFENAIAMHDKSIAKALLVPNLSGIAEQGKVGSYSLGETQMKAFFWTLKADTLRLMDTFNEQVCRQIGDYNWGDDKYPEFMFKPLSMDDAVQIAGVWKELVTAGAVEPTDTDEEFLREILGLPDKGESIKQAPPPMLPGVLPGQGEDSEDDPGTDTAIPGDEDKDGPPKQPEGDPPKTVDESVIGRTVSVSAFSRALKRVQFAVIKTRSEAIEAERASDLEEQLVNSVVELIPRITEDPADMAKLKFNASLSAKIRASTQKVMREGWQLGVQHSRDEISAAKKEPTVIGMGRLDDQALAYFDARSFVVTGDLLDSTLSLIKNTIAMGIKYSWGHKKISDEIWVALNRKGLVELASALKHIEAEDVVATLSEAGISRHRLDTIVRNSVMESMNEARYAFFTDPDLADFVEALEYSAILDSATTEICNHLNGKTYPTNSDLWDGYRPPNHHNCRSVLVPVTVVDEWSPSKDPTVKPQSGFGGGV